MKEIMIVGKNTIAQNYVISKINQMVAKDHANLNMAIKKSMIVEVTIIVSKIVI
jgi:hypothetical protein